MENYFVYCFEVNYILFRSFFAKFVTYISKLKIEEKIEKK